MKMKFLHLKRFMVIALLAMMTNVCWADMIVVTDIGDYKYGLNSNNRTAMLYGFKTNYSSTADVNLVVPETVSSGVYQYTVIGINDQAFQGRDVIKSVSFPSTLETIGNYAFSGCDLGGDLTIGSSVTNIGIGAFAGGHFDDVYFNANLNIGSEVLNLLDAPFDNCSGQLHIGSNVVTIPAGLFRNTNFDGTLDLTNVQYIGTSAFMQSSNLTCGTVLNLSNVQQLGLNAFSGCSGLTGQLVLPNIETIPNAAFDGCSFTGTLVIPNNIKNIDAMAFRDNNFSSITFQATSNLTTIGDNAFYQGITGTSIEIPASVTYIGSSAFADCGNLTNITLQDNSSLTDIYGNAFNGTAWYNALGDNTIVYWYDWCMTYKGSNTSCALNIASVYGDYEIKHIAIEAFQVGMRKKFTSLSLPSTLKTIGKGAFSGCYLIANDNEPLEIPKSVEVIGSYAFEGCYGLQGLTFESESSIKTISDHAFEDCSGLATDLVIPSSVTYLGTYAFSGCSSLTGLEFAEGCALEEIKSNAFVGCESMEGELEIPESVRVIGDNAFAGCLGFTGNLVIPDNVIIIGSEAFYDCSGFGTDLVLGSAVREIGDRAFYGCTGITNISIPEYVTYIGEYAFSDTGWMNNTTSSPAFAGIVYKDGWCLGYYGAAAAAPTGALTIADGTIGIASNAFSGLSGITSLVLPATVTTIGAQAFYNCSGLANIGDLSHIRRMGYHVFVGTAWADNNEDDVMYKDGCCLGWRGRDGGMMKGTNGMKSENYIIPEGTKVIADGAFDMYCFPTDDEYAVLILPSTLEVIGEGAFANCNINGDLTIPANVEYIGDGAIDGWQLSTIYYNAEYCESGFKGQYTDESQMGTTAASYSYPIKGYNKLVIGANVVGIPEKMFAPEFTEVEYRATDAELVSWYGASVTSPFENFTGELNIVNGVVSIDANMFKETQFTGVLTIPSSVTLIGQSAFLNCNGFSEIHLNAVNCKFDYNLPSGMAMQMTDYPPFAGCSGDLTVDANVTVVPDMLFAYSGITSLSFEDNSVVEYIGRYAFNESKNLHSIEIPESVLAINSYAFKDCESISGTVVIPRGVTSIGNQAFSRCINIDTLYYNATDCKHRDVDMANEMTKALNSAFPFNKCGGVLIIGDVDKIDEKMFYMGGFTSLTFETSTVSEIGQGAFMNCTQMTRIYYNLTNCSVTVEETPIAPPMSKAIDDPSGITGPFTSNNAWLILGEDVETIASAMFKNGNYEAITSLAVTPPTAYNMTFYNVNRATPIYVHCGLEPVYQAANYWSEFTNYQEVCHYNFLGTVDKQWSNYMNWENYMYPNDNSDVYIQADCELDVDVVVANLEITAAKVLTVTEGKILEVTNNLVSPKTQTGQISSIIGMRIENGGQVINNCDNVNASIVHNIHMGDGDQPFWQFISSPLQGENLCFYSLGSSSSNLTGGGQEQLQTLLRYNQAPTPTQTGEYLEWENASIHNFGLENGRGYLLSSNCAGAYTVSGVLRYSGNEEDTIQIKLDYITSNPDIHQHGWNLIGNPFPSNAYVNRSYYVIDTDGRQWDPHEKGTSDVISSCAGIMVHTTADDPDKRATFSRNSNSEALAQNNGSLSVTARRMNQRTREMDKIDKVIVSFNEGAELPKFVFDENEAQISIMQDGKAYGIATSDKNGSLPLRVEVPELGFYTLGVDIAEAELSYLHLIDRLTGDDVDLLVWPEYNFTAKKNDNPNRFTLVFKGKDMGDGGNDIFAYQNGSDIIVDGEGELQIFDVMGRMVKATAINGIETINMPENGVYIFRMVGNDIKTQKIVVR